LPFLAFSPSCPLVKLKPFIFLLVITELSWCKGNKNVITYSSWQSHTFSVNITNNLAPKIAWPERHLCHLHTKVKHSIPVSNPWQGNTYGKILLPAQRSIRIVRSTGYKTSHCNGRCGLYERESAT
jgi:hypothetical protein